MLAFAKRFQAFEGEWRRKFPQTKTVGRELSYEAYFDPVALTVAAEPPGLMLTGFIDRVDEDTEGRVVVIDYKSTMSGFTHWNAWVKKRRLQLGFYADVVASGLTELGPREVVGAFYMNMKNFGRDRGMARPEGDGVLFEIGRKKFAISQDEQKELFVELRGVAASAVERMEKGEFSPVPADVKDCVECRWNGLCRGRHLL
jgi:hypothetical protein